MTTSSSPVVAPDAPGIQRDPSQAVATIVRPGDGQSVRTFGNEILFKLTTEQTGGIMSLGLATVTPGKSPPPHIHDREEELFLILEGRYRFLVDGVWIENVGPGSVVFVPRGVAHTFETVGETPGRHWTLQTPSGFERYFARAGELFAAGGPPDFARLAELNAEYGYSFAK